MKQQTQQAIICQHIPQISFIDPEITDVIEAECTLWQQNDCTLIIDFEQPIKHENTLITLCQSIHSKLQYLHDKRQAIITSLAQASGLNADDAILQYIAFFVDTKQQIFCDFALHTASLGEQIAEMSLETDNKILFHRTSRLY